jgi:N-methylhydantoinase A
VSVWVGVDVGGTYTDLVAINSAGSIEARKILSTPSDQSVGVLDALEALGRQDVERFVHGTTVATNMLLERKGARVAFCVTEGFADLLYLRRQNRASLYDLSADYPTPLATRENTVSVPERIEPQGVTTALSEAVARRVAEEVAALNPDIVAILLLHSYRDARHERLLRDHITRRLTGVSVVMSSEVFPEVREYERGTTTVAEAYLRPGVGRYLTSLESRVTRRPGERPDVLGVMTSSGGMRSIAEASTSAAQLALSGPAGGVVGAAAIARELNIALALTIDIGGTSADVGLIVDGEPLVEPGGNIADVPIAMPRVLVETVSAGGGSIAWLDDGGALRVGPHSAGVHPGPVSFGRGGTKPTVTDAHIALGRINAVRMSGGIALDVAAARESVNGLARQLGETPKRTATGIVATADATMARALRRVSVERGINPRDCVLIAFGGGGPLHACGLATLLGIERVIVPPHAGVLSALGLAMTPERREKMTSVMRRLDEWNDGERLTQLKSLEGAAGEGRETCFARMRYVGQGHELDVPVRRRQSNAKLRALFESRHALRYAFTLEAPIEVISLRSVREGRGRRVRFTRGGMVKGQALNGPASLALSDATLFVDNGWRARLNSIGAWMVERR